MSRQYLVHVNEHVDAVVEHIDPAEDYIPHDHYDTREVRVVKLIVPDYKLNWYFGGPDGED